MKEHKLLKGLTKLEKESLVKLLAPLLYLEIQDLAVDERFVSKLIELGKIYGYEVLSRENNNIQTMGRIPEEANFRAGIESGFYFDVLEDILQSQAELIASKDAHPKICKLVGRQAQQFVKDNKS